MTGQGSHKLTLASCGAEARWRVKAVHGGAELKRRLASMGLCEGKSVYKLGGQLFAGPVVVRISSTELAIGHRTAGQVEVEPVADEG